MSDPRRPDWSDPTQGTGGYPSTPDPAYSDPAYSGYWGPAPYGPPNTGYSPPTQPTEQLPPYWQAGTGYPGAPPPPPQPPNKTSPWLWAAAIAAVLLVTGLVLALVIVSNSSKNSTIVAPPSSDTSTTVPRPTVPPTTRTPVPTRTAIPAPLPVPTESPVPTDTGVAPVPSPVPTGTETVVYNVGGQGRAINITYVDTGGIMQTEFNVALPWSKEVTLAAPAKTSASVAVVNIGRDVTCSVTVNGAMVRQRSGRGLTICTGNG